jgi:hypothetical protein
MAARRRCSVILANPRGVALVRTSPRFHRAERERLADNVCGQDRRQFALLTGHGTSPHLLQRIVRRRGAPGPSSAWLCRAAQSAVIGSFLARCLGEEHGRHLQEQVDRGCLLLGTDMGCRGRRARQAQSQTSCGRSRLCACLASGAVGAAAQREPISAAGVNAGSPYIRSSAARGSLSPRTTDACASK